MLKYLNTQLNIMWPVFKNTIMTIIARKAYIINQPPTHIFPFNFPSFYDMIIKL